MGNSSNVPHKITNLKSFWKSKLCKANQRKQSDKFIVDFSRSYHSKLTRITDIDLLDNRRVVFVSLIGLFQTYKLCPSHILYSGICILPLKRDWLYNLSIFIDKNELDYLTKLTIFNSKTDTENFVKLLQWKDSQGLLFFMLDGYKQTNMSLTHPFWIYFSNKLCKLPDTITGNKYKALNLDDAWWENTYAKDKYLSKYETKTADILCELYFLTMKLKMMKEIIYQSNPELLNPITFYGENNDRFKRNPNGFLDGIDSEDIDEKEDEWHFSIDYEYK